jgi:hypothetical protein
VDGYATGVVRATNFVTVPEGGADFAECFESDSGDHYLCGTVVALLPNGKIRRCQQGDVPIGVISNNAAFICGAGDEHWQGKYERDAHGRVVVEDITHEIKDSNGKTITITRKAWKISPSFDPSKPYIPRQQRSEWHVVGMLGLVEVLDGETVHPNWIRLHQKRARPGTAWHLLR